MIDETDSPSAAVSGARGKKGANGAVPEKGSPRSLYAEATLVIKRSVEHTPVNTSGAAFVAGVPAYALRIREPTRLHFAGNDLKGGMDHLRWVAGDATPCARVIARLCVLISITATAPGVFNLGVIAMSLRARFGGLWPAYFHASLNVYCGYAPPVRLQCYGAAQADQNGREYHRGIEGRRYALADNSTQAKGPQAARHRTEERGA